MGFFDVAKNIGKFVINDAIERAQNNQEEFERAYDVGTRATDEQLVKYFKTASSFQKAGYARVLEERGYLEKNSEGKYQRTGKTLNK